MIVFALASSIAVSTLLFIGLIVLPSIESVQEEQLDDETEDTPETIYNDRFISDIHTHGFDAFKLHEERAFSFYPSITAIGKALAESDVTKAHYRHVHTARQSIRADCTRAQRFTYRYYVSDASGVTPIDISIEYYFNQHDTELYKVLKIDGGPKYPTSNTGIEVSEPRDTDEIFFDRWTKTLT